MPTQNAHIAHIFNKLADLLEIEGANPFRVRAYRNAARKVANLGRSVSDMVIAGEDLTALTGIGKDLADKIREIVETGRLSQLEETEAKTPGELSRLMRIATLGPKRVKTLYQELGITSREALKDAAEKGKVQELEGFGKKSEQVILEELRRANRQDDARIKLFEAEQAATNLTTFLKKAKAIKAITVAGSFRRKKDTVGDLDILVTSKRGSGAMKHFLAYDDIHKVLSQGKTRSTVALRSGLQVDLRVVPEVSYGAALHYFTGSKSHTVAIRKLGVKQGYKINEYGVFKGDKRIAGRTEKEVYAKVGLPYIEPELRENQGELQAARKGRLPELVALKDLRGDLHSHTIATDGQSSLEEMAQAAKRRGYEYLAITEHSKKVAMARGLNVERLAGQIEAIDRLNEELEGIILLKGIEVDILEDGSLDLPNDILKRLDLRVCSVHYNHRLSRKKQTARIIRAMDNPYFNILAHPTGRLINERKPYAVDLEKVMTAAIERGCFLEINANPDRLDLADRYCRMAKEMGLKLAVSTDAHSPANLDFIRFGVDQARRGWLEADDVINTRGLSELKAMMKR
ncbi:DNA polymerase/3'-5' exonuclease PolX [Desulfatitalea alkaliphila]|uniref:DNA polymerase beta n=1 Tax=Desulfatitalea alkaliphila TaxID=2929485 RepID=A0AA41R0I5_9BACT|nr:DNA polymerase/3'-5' exonuclease PolX [Desulfatitalea alkaliphila]MCJ8498985.1 DNA polymerase/3'-5' exonuclease PolX [Desulfatitalea alkaliphila]